MKLKMLKRIKNIFPDCQTAIICHKFKHIRRYCTKGSERTYPKRIFSGIQPTGNIHIGNYLGTIQKWIELQNSEQVVLWSIVDMHSITLPQDPQTLKENTLNVLATLIACGIDPKKSIVFQQSMVPMHAELCWVLGCITTMARLKHLPQYKEKSATLKNVPLGLFIYPVLQAADVLLYRATHVPVGLDQAQHIHLAQDLAEIFNTKFGDTFPVPHKVVSDGPNQRIKSLLDASKKMSKSDEPKTRIDLIDSPDMIYRKIKKAVTDFTPTVTYDPEERQGVANLVAIHSLLTGKSPQDICKEVEDLDTGKYKLVLADVIIENLRPIQEEYFQLVKEPLYLEGILKEGSEKTAEIALDCWLDVRNKIGFGATTIGVNTKCAQGIAQSI